MAPAPAPSSITVSDITIGITQLILKGGRKEKDRAQSDFRVHYFITLSKKCCHSGGKRIHVGSNHVLWVRGEYGMEKDYEMEMKALTLSALQRHKDEAKKRERTAAWNTHRIPGLSHKQIWCGDIFGQTLKIECENIWWLKERNQIQRNRDIRVGQAKSLTSNGWKSRISTTNSKDFEPGRPWWRHWSYGLGNWHCTSKLRKASVEPKIELDEYSLSSGNKNTTWHSRTGKVTKHDSVIRAHN